MKIDVSKPIRIDYYPKTKEGIKEAEEIQVEEDLEQTLGCKGINTEHGRGINTEYVDGENTNIEESVEGDEIMTYSGSMPGDVEIMEKFIEEIIGQEKDEEI